MNEIFTLDEKAIKNDVERDMIMKGSGLVID